MGKKPAFTLVEIVVVVLILGILTAIAAPRFFDVSAEARDNGLRQSLATVREALDLWKVENGRFPSSSPEYRDLMDTRLRGRFPACPVGNGVPQGIKVVADGKPLAGTGGAGTAGQPMWKYDNTTGEIIVNYHAMSHDGSYYDEW